MRCPACHAVNARRRPLCPLQQGVSTQADAGGPRPRSRTRPAAARTEESNRAALRAYRLSLFGLIPLVGLVLGPAALVLGVSAGHRAAQRPRLHRPRPRHRRRRPRVLDALTNWGGVVLMVLGLLSMFAW